jgi:hypothetical protein
MGLTAASRVQNELTRLGGFAAVGLGASRLAALPSSIRNDFYVALSEFAKNRRALPIIFPAQSELTRAVELFASISPQRRMDCLSARRSLPLRRSIGEVLDLRKVGKAHRGFLLDRALSPRSGTAVDSSPAISVPIRIMDAVLALSRVLQGIGQDPTSYVKDVFDAMSRTAGRMGFENISIYYPQSNGKWVRGYMTHDWTALGPAPSKFSPEFGGDLSHGSIQAILESPHSIFEVDLRSPESYRAAGLEYNPVAVERDLKHSTGSTQLVYIKVISSHGVEAIVKLQNRVKLNQGNPGPLLPTDSVTADRIKYLWEMYFKAAGSAISEIHHHHEARVRTENVIGSAIEPPQKQFSVEHFLSMGKKVYLAGGRKAVFFHIPIQHVNADEIKQAVHWIQGIILGVYRGSSVARGKTDLQLLKALDAEEAAIESKILRSTYLGIVLNEEGNDGVGIVSGDFFMEKGDAILYVAGSMIQPEARGSKAQTYIVTNLMMNRWAKYAVYQELGTVRGLIYHLFKGIALVARFQSRRPAYDMMRTKHFHVTGMEQFLEGREKQVNGRTLRILETLYSKQHVTPDSAGVLRNFYPGEIAIREEEKSLLFERKGFWGWIDLITGAAQRRRAIDKLFSAIGEKDALYGIGYFTYPTVIKIAIELLLTKLSRSLFVNREPKRRA